MYAYMYKRNLPKDVMELSFDLYIVMFETLDVMS